MTYVFTFLGEFGYELFNWQGVIRKFAATLGPDDRIICCSRAGLAPLYEVAARYVDISNVRRFRQSVANMYFAMPDRETSFASARFLPFADKLKNDLRSYILRALGERPRADNPWGWLRLQRPRWLAPEGVRFVFSCDRVELNGCCFGTDPFGPPQAYEKENIYERLDLNNNIYRKIAPVPEAREAVERSLGFALDEPFVLCQARRRQIVNRSTDRVPHERLVEALAPHIKVVLLSFATGRRLDSYSAFDRLPNCHRYACGTFPEQACLIDAARHCLFFTEGDFGSHIYVPPFMGRNVTAIAPRSVYHVQTTPIDFWNRHVFRFGGQIIPRVAEEVFASPQSIEELARAAAAG